VVLDFLERRKVQFGRTILIESYAIKLYLGGLASE
jgi:hypothetical protein